MIFYAVASYDNLHVYNFLKRKKKKKRVYRISNIAMNWFRDDIIVFVSHIYVNNYVK